MISSNLVIANKAQHIPPLLHSLQTLQIPQDVAGRKEKVFVGCYCFIASVFAVDAQRDGTTSGGGNQPPNMSLPLVH